MVCAAAIKQAVRRVFSAHRKINIPFLSGLSLQKVYTAVALLQSSTIRILLLFGLIHFEKWKCVGCSLAGMTARDRWAS